VGCLLLQDKLVSTGVLRHSDQFCIDKAGNTLLMVAAHSGSLSSMKFLLSQPHCPVNAQNQKVVNNIDITGCFFVVYSGSLVTNMSTYGFTSYLPRSRDKSGICLHGIENKELSNRVN